jgi:hypothetical protein
MNHELNGGLARGRVDEMIAHADQYRLAQPELHRRRQVRLDEIQRFAFRRALAAVGLSILLVLSFSSIALAIPADSGSGGSERSMVRSSHSESVEASSGTPLAGLSLALVTGVGAIVVLRTKRRARHA